VLTDERQLPQFSADVSFRVYMRLRVVAGDLCRAVARQPPNAAQLPQSHSSSLSSTITAPAAAELNPWHAQAGQLTEVVHNQESSYILP